MNEGGIFSLIVETPSMSSLQDRFSINFEDKIFQNDYRIIKQFNNSTIKQFNNKTIQQYNNQAARRETPFENLRETIQQ